MKESNKLSLAKLGRDEVKHYFMKDRYSVPTMTAVLTVLRENYIERGQQTYQVAELRDQSEDLLKGIFQNGSLRKLERGIVESFWYLIGSGNLRLEQNHSLTVTRELREKLIQTAPGISINNSDIM